MGWRSLELGPVPLFAVCAPIAILVPGGLLAALARITRATVFLRWAQPTRMGEL